MEKRKNTLKNMKYKHIFGITMFLVALFLCSFSGVSAATYNLTDSNTTGQFQNIIDSDVDDEVRINLDEGDYDFGQINISRNATIVGKGSNTVISGTGTLFNVTASNVQIINLTISGYQTAITSNASSLTIKNNKITTDGVSINLTSNGASNPISNVVIEDNNIISHVSGNNLGTVYLSGVYNDKAVFDVLFKNNNITADGSNVDGVYLGDSNRSSVVSSANLVFENNNITAASGTGVSLNAYENNNSQFIFTNNNITGNGDGVYMNIYDINNINITFNDNNITGTVNDGLHMNAYTNNNSQFIFTNNNLTGTATGAYFYAYDSKNTDIAFNNNNITAQVNGVYLFTTNSKNININLINNNITEPYDGVYLFAANSSESQFTLANNNIIGTLNGVYIEAFINNNTNITFDNNNITGFRDTVSLITYGSNNTNMAFDNNNIIGTEYGVYLHVSNSSNSQFNLIKNNITGGDYGVYFYSFGGNVSGVSFLNNTINSTSGDGFYFDSQFSTMLTNINNFIVSGNTIFAPNGAGFNFTGLFTGSLVNVTVEYNRILSLIGVDITGYNDESSFDYNWWGVNDITGKILGIGTNNHYILNITNLTSLNHVKVGDKVSFALLVLNTTLTNEGVENLPYFVINGTFNGVNYSTSRDNSFLYNFTILNEGIQKIDASLDNQYVNLTFSAVNSTKKPTIIVVIDGTGKVGEDTTLIAKLTDDDGNPIANAVVDFYYNGKKIGSAKTNSNGIATLTYKFTSEGIYQITANFAGDNNYLASSGTGQISVSKTNNSNDEPVNPTVQHSKASMKNTGLPIVAVLIVLISCIGLLGYRKKE